MTKKRILVVDDETNLSQIVQRSLERTGAYEVQTECLGLRAIETALAFRPHLFLLDVCLLDTDGGMVAERILSDAQLKHIPIIFMTSLVTPQETVNGPIWNSGVPILSKPFEAQKLIACIESSLAGRSAQVTGAVLEKRISDTKMIKKTLVDRKLVIESAVTA